MRLYLSSFRLGNRPDALPDLLNGGRRAAVIINAADSKTDEERAASYERERSDLADLGLDPYELDLRDYFDRPDAMLTPNLHGAELVDDPANVPPGYPPELRDGEALVFDGERKDIVGGRD